MSLRVVWTHAHCSVVASRDIILVQKVPDAAHACKMGNEGRSVHPNSPRDSKHPSRPIPVQKITILLQTTVSLTVSLPMLVSQKRQ